MFIFFNAAFMPRNKTGHSESIQVILCDFSNAEDLTKTEVSGGNVKLNGTLTVELERPGGETVIGDIIRMLDEEQGKEAPVQRLADKVAGNFTYGVMALSAATFMFWNLLEMMIHACKPGTGKST